MKLKDLMYYVAFDKVIIENAHYEAQEYSSDSRSYSELIEDHGEEDVSGVWAIEKSIFRIRTRP